MSQVELCQESLWKSVAIETKSPGSWRELSEPCLSSCWWRPITQGSIIWLPVGVKPAHLHVTKLAALCAHGTLNFYLIHVRIAWATATFSSFALQFPLSFFFFFLHFFFFTFFFFFFYILKLNFFFSLHSSCPYLLPPFLLLFFLSFLFHFFSASWNTVLLLYSNVAYSCPNMPCFQVLLPQLRMPVSTFWDFI